jgi:hypothetical protein
MKPGRARLTLAALAALGLVAALAAYQAWSNGGMSPSPALTCRLPRGVEQYPSFDALPAAMRQFLALRFAEPPSNPGIAERNAAYEATDLLRSSLPMRRAIGTGRAGTQWFLWYEHGGYGPHMHFVLLTPGFGESEPQVLANITTSTRRLCALTNAVLTGRAARSIEDEW